VQRRRTPAWPDRTPLAFLNHLAAGAESFPEAVDGPKAPTSIRAAHGASAREPLAWRLPAPPWWTCLAPQTAPIPPDRIPGTVSSPPNLPDFRHEWCRPHGEDQFFGLGISDARNGGGDRMRLPYLALRDKRSHGDDGSMTAAFRRRRFRRPSFPPALLWTKSITCASDDNRSSEARQVRERMARPVHELAVVRQQADRGVRKDLAGVEQSGRIERSLMRCCCSRSAEATIRSSGSRFSTPIPCSPTRRRPP